jgi:hypothetical protein
MRFKTPTEANKFFEAWEALSEGSRLSAIRNLKQNGNLTFVGKLKVESDFICPRYQFQVAKPCSLSSCPYHLQHAASLNCMVNCLDTAKNNRLQATEITQVTSTPTAQVHALCDSGMKKIQLCFVRDALDRYGLSRFDYLPYHCVACETDIEEELFHVENASLKITDDFGWCSTACQKARPLWQFKLERHFRCDYLDVLTVATNLFRDSQIVESVLDVPPSQLKVLRPEIQERLDYLA